MDKTPIANNENNYTVYMHLNLTNLKKYIGMTNREPEERWGLDGIHYKGSPKFYNAIQKHGWNNFAHIILYKELTKQEAEEIERSLISFYSANGAFGYNIANGGNHVGKHSDETKRKIGEKNLGKKHSEEFKENIRKRQLGRKISEETKKKMSEAKKGKALSGLAIENARKVNKERLKDKKLPDWITERAKIINSERQKGKPVLAFAKYNETLMKKVIQYDKCGKYINTFNSVSEAARAVNTYSGNICNAIVGKNRRKTAGGYIWKYADDVLGKTHGIYKCNQCGEEFINFIFEWTDIDENGKQVKSVYAYHDCGNGYFGAGFGEFQGLKAE